MEGCLPRRWSCAAASSVLSGDSRSTLPARPTWKVMSCMARSGSRPGAFVQGTIRQSDDPLSSVQLIETAPSTDSERYDLALPEEVDDDVAEARYVGHRQIRRRPLLLRRRAAE